MDSKRRLLIAALVLLLAAGAGVAYLLLRAASAISELDTQLDRYESIGQAGDVLMEVQGEAARREAERLRLNLPSSASDIWFARQDSEGALYWLRFDLPPDALESFLAPCFASPLQAGSNPGFEYASNPDVIANLEWWTSDTAASFSGGECSPREGVDYRLLVDQSAADTWTVYLEIVTE